MLTSEQMTQDFIKQIAEGYIHPEHMASVLYAMHGAMMDRFDDVANWLPADLEMVADTVVNAINLVGMSNEEGAEV